MSNIIDGGEQTWKPCMHAYTVFSAMNAALTIVMMIYGGAGNSVMATAIFTDMLENLVLHSSHRMHPNIIRMDIYVHMVPSFLLAFQA